MLSFSRLGWSSNGGRHPVPPADLVSIGMYGAGVTLRKSPEKELEEFLASKPAWMQRVLHEDFSSFSRDEHLEWISNQDRVTELRPEYERILQQIPTKWREYRKRLKQNSQLLVQVLMPKGKPGRRRDSRAEEYATLHPSKSYRQMAKEELHAEPEGEAKGLLIEKESERIRALVRRSRRRKSN